MARAASSARVSASSAGDATSLRLRCPLAAPAPRLPSSCWRCRYAWAISSMRLPAAQRHESVLSHEAAANSANNSPEQIDHYRQGRESESLGADGVEAQHLQTARRVRRNAGAPRLAGQAQRVAETVIDAGHLRQGLAHIDFSLVGAQADQPPARADLPAGVPGSTTYPSPCC